MNLVDANVLVYAVNPDAEHHRVANRWLDESLSGSSTVLLPWLSLMAFARISTHPAIFERPMSVDEAMDIVDAWLTRPTVVVPEPDHRHSARMRDLLVATGTGGNLVNDAHLAALALQHRASVISYDNDFDRFPGVRWERPAA